MGYTSLKRGAENRQEMPQYSVYVYHYPEDTPRGHTDWEMKRMTHNRFRAVRMAERYHESATYQRVEIKKKYFNSKYDRMVDKTVRVMERQKKPLNRVRLIALCGGVLCVGVAAIGGLLLF